LVRAPEEAAKAYDKKALSSGRKVILNFNPVTGQRNVDATFHRGASTAVVHSSSSGQPPRQGTTSLPYDDFDDDTDFDIGQFKDQGDTPYAGLFTLFKQQQQGGGGGAASQSRGGRR
jgi:hypothetical protein